MKELSSWPRGQSSPNVDRPFQQFDEPQDSIVFSERPAEYHWWPSRTVVTMKTDKLNVHLLLLLVSVGPLSADGLSWHEIRSHALQWPRQPSALSDDSLARIAARMVAPEMQSDFNRTLDTICVERQPGTEAHTKVRQFIADELRALDWTVDEHSFSDTTPHGRKPFTNIIATLDPSACHRLVLACHYDSKVMKNFVAATDSAVPCSQMINIVKALDPELKSHRDRKTDLSLQLIFFDGEEAYEQWSSTDSLYGSRQLADQLDKTRFLYGPENRCGSSTGKNLISELDRIEVFVLLDLLGAKNPNFYSFFADTKELFDQMTDIELRLNNLGLMEGRRTKYFTGKSQFGGIEDDHIPFMRKDVPILHIIPHPFPRVWHKTSDNKQNLDWTTIWNLNKIFSAFLAWYMEL